MSNNFIACLCSINGKLELNVYSPSSGLQILGSRHERAENGQYFAQVVRDFHSPENSTDFQIAVQALEAVQQFLDKTANRPKKEKK